MKFNFLGQNIAKDHSAYQRQVCFVGHKTGINPNLTLKEIAFSIFIMLPHHTV